MFKKVVSVAMAVVLAGALMACGNSSNSSTGSTGGSNAGSDETAADVKWPKTVEIVVPASCR